MHRNLFIIIITHLNFKKWHVTCLFILQLDHLQKARQFMRLAKFIQ
jgi:hypothetical protein